VTDERFAAGPAPDGGARPLIVAAVLFVGWLSWLGYAALTKSRAPVVSHAQAATAPVAVVAELTAARTAARSCCSAAALAAQR
jgi:hypothetical protein